MVKSKAMREKLSKVVAGSKRRAEKPREERSKRKREENKERKRQMRLKEKLETNRHELHRKRGEDLTKEEVRLVLSMCHHFLDEVTEEEALHQALVVTGILKHALARVVEDWDWEHRQGIRVYDMRGAVAWHRRGVKYLFAPLDTFNSTQDKMRKGSRLQQLLKLLAGSQVSPEIVIGIRLGKTLL